MLLQDVLSSEFIKVEMKAEDKAQAFKELVNYYCKADKSESYTEILEAINAREAKMSTGIHKGVAVPHGKTKAVKTIRGVLGISKKGIPYDSLDGEPVNLLFMIISPMEDSENHLRLLKHLSELMEIPQFKIDLKKQKNPQNACNVIRKYEEMLCAK